MFSMLFSIFFTTGCSSSSEVKYHSHVKPIIEARCLNCHSSGDIGSVDLTDLESLSVLAPVIANAVSTRAMPPWPADPGVGFSNDWSLTEDEIQIIVDWSDGGGKMGDPEDAGTELDIIGTSLSRVDRSITMTESYSPPPEQGDDYRCFVLPWDAETPTNITGFNARPGNPAIVHHIAAFLVRPDGLLGDSVFEQIEEWDSDDEISGYPCFGGPAGPGGGVQVPIEQIAQWVPGNQGLDFPDGTGIRIDPGSQIILQVHYYAAPGITDTADRTSVEFSLEEEIQHPSAYAPWLNGAWPMGGMELPEGEEEIEHVIQGDPRPFFNFLNSSLELDSGFDIHSMMLHMHRLGKSGDLTLVRASGEEETLLSVSRWDFDWQFTYVLTDPVRFEDGDELRLRCVFDNSGPDAVDVSWGEGTDDEMCVGNIYISQL